MTTVSLAYQLDGQPGAPILDTPQWLVLGSSLGTAASMWQPQVEPFATHFRVTGPPWMPKLHR